LCEFWYNSNWHSSFGHSPFQVIYGHQPRYFGITASDHIAPADVDKWLEERKLLIAAVRLQLLCMQQRMKVQADKHRFECTFLVGDEVFLKLQPYVQSYVVHSASHKLSFKYYGPYRIL
jgi:hypothetical protein